MPPEPSRLETGLLLTGAVLSPLWFLHPPSLNITPTDILFLIAILSYCARTGAISLAPSRTTLIGVGLFLVAGAVGAVNSPVPGAGLLNFIQYGFIFGVIVTGGLTLFIDRANRWRLLVGLSIVINLLAVLTVVELLTTSTPLAAVSLWYSNQNQLQWLLASGVFLNLGVAASTQRLAAKMIPVTAGFYCLFLVLGATTHSAILLLLTGGWVATSWVLISNGRVRAKTIGYTTGAVSILGVVFVARFWDAIYRYGSLKDRFAQYEAAVRIGVEHFPFGVGFEGTQYAFAGLPDYVVRSVHNYFLAYFLEIGILGAFAFTLILADWARSVMAPLFRTDSRYEWMDVPFVAIFAGYIIVILFQPVPVRRFWWIIFSASWCSYLVTQNATIQETRSANTDTDTKSSAKNAD